MSVRTVETTSTVEMMQKFAQDNSQESNTALMELDKGLRSTKVGEQCEAIVCVPALMEKFPLPLLVNSAFLKLSDVFRAGTNFMKLCVLKAVQSSRKHLNKITNVELFSRNFYTVIHSNDPIARAVTLRIFGHIASVVAEQKNIQHCIETSLDSQDEMEIEAAVFAARCFAEQSASFAERVWSKIADMVKGLSTPIEMKVKLIRIFRYMHHDIAVARKVQEICEELLIMYPALRTLVVLLNTLTHLTAVTLVNVPQQINLLLDYLQQDPRQRIRLVVTNNLLYLASKSSQLWTSEHVTNLAMRIVECENDSLKQKMLSVLCTLSRKPGCSSMFSVDSTEVLCAVTQSCNVQTSAMALRARTDVLIDSLATNSTDNSSTDSSTDSATSSAMELLVSDLLMQLAISVSDESLTALRYCLSSTQLIVRTSPTSSTSLTSFLIDSLPTLRAAQLENVCHALVTMATRSPDPIIAGRTQFFVELLPALLRDYVDDAMPGLASENSVVGMCTLLFQSAAVVGLSSELKIELQDKMLEELAGLFDSERNWTLYKIGRQAARLSFPRLAAKLFSGLVGKVSSENFHFWLRAIASFQEAEAVLRLPADSVARLQQLLSQAHGFYQDGLTSLKASVTIDHPMFFQFKFARLRSDTLQAYAQLLTCCATSKITPPPAVAMTISMATGQEVHQLSRLASQFQQCANLFSNVVGGYQFLYASSFNADHTSLLTMQMLRESCQLFVYAIESLVAQRTNERLSPDFIAVDTSDVDEKMNEFLRSLSSRNLGMLTDVEQLYKDLQQSSVSQKQTDFLAALIPRQLGAGMCFPLHFFKTLQKTRIQLSVTPGNSLATSPHPVDVTQDLLLKVEGVIMSDSECVCFRSMTSVSVRVRVQPAEGVKRCSLHENKLMDPEEMVLQDTCDVKNEYFCAQFLIPFGFIGRHTLQMNIGVTDERGVSWETGPNGNVFVDVYEHGHHKKK